MNMDLFPEDLLAGVFPLVFAVDAIQGNDGGSPRRSLFDRFLDAVAVSLVEEAPEKKLNSLSLFRSELEDESGHDALEEFSFGQQSQRTSSSISSGIYPGFHAGFGKNKVMNRSLSSESTDSNKVTVFAKTLSSGQDFFQQARIEPISARHGFPPSKDPEGSKNLSRYLHQVVKRKKIDSLSDLFQHNRVEGILPAGWLEKHAHALPSVIMVVCNVTSDRSKQEKQDTRLYETIEHLKQNLVPKRNCKIHVIGLLQDDVTPTQGDIWGRSVSSEFVVNHGLQPNPDLPIHVTLLRASSDLQANDTGMPTSPALKRLHRTIRDSSLSYYIHQARRAKDKLSMMLGLKDGVEFSSPPPQLLPLVIRYCFKIAMFYEFQGKEEKLLLYMSEGYRYASKYYQFLVSKDMKASVDASGSGDYKLESAAHMGEDDDVEVSLVEAGGVISWQSLVPEAPNDMIHQCRVLAEWMHMKVLSAAFSSRTEPGLFAASEQWREHSRVFCSSIYRDNMRIPHWYQWSYVVRQRIVFSQLVERYPPSLANDNGDRELAEVLLQCSIWRAHASAAEAILRLSLEVEKAFNATKDYGSLENESENADIMRPQYVGAIGSKGLLPLLVDERRVGHKALEFVLRAVTLYEAELEQEKRGFYAEDSFSESASSREGARMHYLAGGILLGMGRHEQATSSLAKAAMYASGWQQLELAIRRMLIECYEKYIPAESETSESGALGSMILDSYFNAEMSPQELRKALGHFLSISGGESLKWFHKTVDDEDTSLPFSFAVSFPWKTHATCGDTVQASVLIRSNLDYAVHVNSVVLLSLAGELSIQNYDLRSATNASEGSEEGIIIQAKTAIIISTEVVLPRDTSFIASDESGNGGEQFGVAGKGSFAKSARPRSAGVTAAGGARFLAEDTISDGAQQSQGWNLRFLGGKPFAVTAEKSGVEKDSLTFIELTILKEKPRTAANIKRTPFEEENYIASAWSRPALRVSGPVPHLAVTNVTDELTSGKAVEGTVNRIVLKLQAGLGEICSNIKISISCFSVLVTPSGSTKRLVAKEDITVETENSLDMSNPTYRTPALVCREDESSGSSPLGYCTPSGWVMLGSGQTQENVHLSALNKGECSYVSLNLFRPASKMEVDLEPTESSVSERLADWSVCKTDYYVTVSYQQERPSTKKTRPATRGQRRSLRRPPTMPGLSNESDNASQTSYQSMQDDQTSEGEQLATDDVTLEFTGSAVWTTPLTATFSRGSGDSCPSGSRHPSNSSVRDPLYAAKEFALVDGDSVTAVCHLKLDSAMEGLETDIVSIAFKPGDESDPQTDLVLKSQAIDGVDGLLYKTTADDKSRRLSTTDAEFLISYVVEGKMRPNVLRGGLSSHLGVIEVEWLPKTLSLSPDIASDRQAVAAGIGAHGPLALSTPSIVRFRGPPFYIESAPFHAEMIKCTDVPSASKPFEVAYRIQNNTISHQHLLVKLHTLPVVDGAQGAEGDSLLLAGNVQGDLTLNPSEARTLSYIFLALRPGLLKLPALEVLSTRYGTYVVQEQGKNREIFVLP